MGQVTFSWPDTQDPRVINGLAKFFGYDPDEHGAKVPFVRSALRHWARRAILRSEADEAVQAARDDIMAAAPPDVEVT